MDFNYKIIFAILLSLIVGYVIYIYFFKKPVNGGEKLKDVQAQQLILQHELLHPPNNPDIDIKTLKKLQVEESEQDQEYVDKTEDEDMNDDNLTRESLYEEILKLDSLKNPVDFLYKFDINSLMKGMMNPPHIEEYKEGGGLEEVETVDLEEVETDEIADYPQDTEAFGVIEEVTNLDEDDISKKIFSDMLNMDKEVKKELELTEVPKKKKIVIKKK